MLHGDPVSFQGWESEARDPQGVLRKGGLGARLILQQSIPCLISARFTYSRLTSLTCLPSLPQNPC